jgi:hypothetical protein
VNAEEFIGKAVGTQRDIKKELNFIIPPHS